MPDPAVSPASRRAWWPWIIAVAIVAVAVFAWRQHASRPETGATAPRVGGVAVVAASVQRASMAVRRRYPGELFADAVELSSRIAGHVRTIDVRIGDAVSAGSVIAQLDDGVLRRQIRETKAEIRAQRSSSKSAVIASEAAQRDLARARGLASHGAVSAQEIDALETASRQREADVATRDALLEQAQARLAVLQEDLQDTTIRAPFTGTIARRDVDAGAFVAAGTPLVRIVADDPLRVRFRVPEHDVAGIAPGMLFRLQTRQQSGEAPTGTVHRLAGEVTMTDRTLLVEGVMNTREGLKPGMFADVELDVQELHDALVVPADAFIERVDAAGRAAAGVFVVAGDEARWVDVRLLGREEDRVAVEAELDVGDQVLVRGHRELADGSEIRVMDEGAS